jgi:hypothetical protein
MAQIDLGKVAATVTVGTTTTVGGDSGASVTNSGTTSDAVLNFSIPSGCYSIVQPSGTTQALNPQTVYVWGEVSSLNITLSAPTNNEIVNEYIFQFNSGSTATSLSLPSDVIFTSAVTIEANMHYECNIMYNSNDDAYYGIIVGWSAS